MNSTSRQCLAVLAILLALPVQAQTPAPKPAPAPAPAPGKQPSAPAKPAATTASRTRIDTAFDGVRQKVLAGDTDRAAYEELVTAINASYESMAQATPGTNTVRTRLVAALDDIYARAKKGKIAPEEFSTLRVEMLDAQMHNLLAEAAVSPGEKSLETLGTSLKQLADASQEIDPATGGWRTRAQALLDDLKKKPALEATDLEPLHEELTHAATLRSEVLLEKHATAKALTPMDFTRVRDHVSDLLDLQGSRDPSARELKEKLSDAIDELEQHSKDAALTPADFDSLRKELAQRGRTALAEKQKPHG